MKSNSDAKKFLEKKSYLWLITGVAGFIGSNLAEYLLLNNQQVIGIDNLSTGSLNNLDEIEANVGKNWKNFTFIKSDVNETESYKSYLKDIDYVLYQAALGSVPRSIKNPRNTNESNVSGFLSFMDAIKHFQNIKNLVYASSSSVYGDHESLPKIEDRIGSPLSPYALTKLVNEQYAEVFYKCYGLKSTGLRYFNVFGKRQDPNGAYAAVIPKWIDSMIKNEDIFINGDGETSRDFCFIDNVVQANILAAITPKDKSQIFNVAVGSRTTLLELFEIIKKHLKSFGFNYDKPVIFKDFRKGDVRHSEANISKIKKDLCYSPQYVCEEGLYETVKWFISRK